MADEASGYFFSMALGGALVWAYFHYWGDPKPEKKPDPIRPTLPITVIDTKDTTWTLFTDTIIGPRKARQGWVKMKQNKPDASTDYTMQLWRVNCDTMETTMVESTGYLPSGDVAWDNRGGSFSQYYGPYSYGNEVVSRLCAANFDKPPEPLILPADAPPPALQVTTPADKVSST